MNDTSSPVETDGVPSVSIRWGDAAFAAFLAIIGIIIFWQTAGVASGPSYERVGPRLFPWLIASGLIAVSIGLMFQTLRRSGHWTAIRFDVRAALHIIVGIVALLVLLEPAGFVVAATCLFVSVARAFGSRRLVFEIAIGAALTLVSQFIFTKGLGLDLPWGLLSFLD